MTDLSITAYKIKNVPNKNPVSQYRLETQSCCLAERYS